MSLDRRYRLPIYAYIKGTDHAGGISPRHGAFSLSYRCPRLVLAAKLLSVLTFLIVAIDKYG